MQIKMTPGIRELVDILYHYEKEHGEIDENAPKEIWHWSKFWGWAVT